MKLESKRAIVVGASSGIGAAVARRLARAGWRVALVARRAEQLGEVAEAIARRGSSPEPLVVAHDATDYDAVPALFDRIVDELGGLDTIVYAAGIMPEVAEDEYDFAKDRAMVEVNLLGMIAWTNQAADFFARVRGGVICGIGSVAGDRGRKDRPGYNTSKGAQAIFLEALRNRLAALDVAVLTVKPGPVSTPMTAHLGNQPFLISADEAARRIVDAIRERRNGTLYVPRRWRYIMAAICAIPSPIFRKLGI